VLLSTIRFRAAFLSPIAGGRGLSFLFFFKVAAWDSRYPMTLPMLGPFFFTSALACTAAEL